MCRSTDTVVAGINRCATNLQRNRLGRAAIVGKRAKLWVATLVVLGGTQAASGATSFQIIAAINHDPATICRQRIAKNDGISNGHARTALAAKDATTSLGTGYGTAAARRSILGNGAVDHRQIIAASKLINTTTGRVAASMSRAARATNRAVTVQRAVDQEWCIVVVAEQRAALSAPAPISTAFAALGQVAVKGASPDGVGVVGSVVDRAARGSPTSVAIAEATNSTIVAKRAGDQRHWAFVGIDCTAVAVTAIIPAAVAASGRILIK